MKEHLPKASLPQKRVVAVMKAPRLEWGHEINRAKVKSDTVHSIVLSILELVRPHSQTIRVKLANSICAKKIFSGLSIAREPCRHIAWLVLKVSNHSLDFEDGSHHFQEGAVKLCTRGLYSDKKVLTCPIH